MDQTLSLSPSFDRCRQLGNGVGHILAVVCPTPLAMTLVPSATTATLSGDARAVLRRLARQHLAMVVDGPKGSSRGLRLSMHHLLVIERHTEESRAAPDAGPPPPGTPAALRPLGVDRRLVAVVADLDAPWLGFLGHRNREPQNAVVVAGLDLVGVEIFAQE